MRDGIENIKTKILQLAISGKLVKQNPEDEPADILYEKIQEEKEKLIKEKKIRRVNLDYIKEDEIPFEIPNSWKWVRLGSIANIVGGGTPKTKINKYWENGTINWLTPADLGGYKEKYILNGRRNITELGLKESSAQLMPKGTILFSSRAPIGYVAISEDTISTNQGFKSCIPYHHMDSEYIYYYLKKKGEEINNASSGTTFKEVSGREMNKVMFSLPPLNEQKKIVEKIDKLFSLLDSIIDFKQDSIKIIDLLEKKVLDMAIQGKLVEQVAEDEPADIFYEKIQEEKEKIIKEKKIRKVNLAEIKKEEIPFGIPDSWKWVKLGSLSENIHYGYTASAVHENTGVKMLRITDIQKNTVNWKTVPFCEITENRIMNYKLSKNDILIARTGGTIGKTFMVNEIMDETVVFASYLIRVIPISSIDVSYMKYFLESKLYWKQLKDKSQGTGQPNVNATALNNLIISLPPLNEQKRIVIKLDLIMSYLKQIKYKLD